METDRRTALKWLLTTGAIAGGSTGVAEEAWKPSRPIRLVVPFPPGGGADILGRLTAPGVSARLGQPVVVENKGGASGTIGAEHVYRASADGSVLLLATVDTQAVNPQIAKVPFDASKFVPLGGIAQAPYVLVGKSGLPATTFAELLDLMKTRQLTYASAGFGSVTHVLGASFGRESRNELIHVAYQGSGPATQAILGGDVDLGWMTLQGALQYRNRVHLYATPSEERFDLLKDVPTMKERGLPVVGASWLGWVAPPDTPEPVAAALSRAVRDTVSSPEILQRLREMGMVPIQMSQQAFVQFYRDEYEKWGKIVRAAKIGVN
ncbi:MAG: Bug family tripartite tricarboxylate transporter substrate binding protein [Lautropia sp.]